MFIVFKTSVIWDSLLRSGSHAGSGVLVTARLTFIPTGEPSVGSSADLQGQETRLGAKFNLWRLVFMAESAVKGQLTYGF